MTDTLAKKDSITYLALGDSYTKGESVDWLMNWPNQLVKKLEDTGIVVTFSKIIAQTGWRTDNLKDVISLQKPVKADIVSLLIGVNNYYQGKSSESFEPEFENLLKTAIILANDRPDRVFVLSIPDYGYTPYGASNQKQITEGIDKYNLVCERVCKTMGIHYFFITDITRRGLEEPDLVSIDGLHPSGKAYSEFVQRIFPEILRMIKNQ